VGIKAVVADAADDGSFLLLPRGLFHNILVIFFALRHKNI
jgi:hypothetical protein